MNSKEKAKELVEKFKKYSSTTINEDVFDDYDRLNGKTKRTFKQVLNHSNLYHAKQCALIAVDEIIKSLKNSTSHLTLREADLWSINDDISFWREVKTEIEKL